MYRLACARRMVLIAEKSKKPYVAVIVAVARGTVQKGYDSKSFCDDEADVAEEDDCDEDVGAQPVDPDDTNTKAASKKKKGSKHSTVKKTKTTIPRHLRVPRFIGVSMDVNLVSKLLVARLFHVKNGMRRLLYSEAFHDCHVAWIALRFAFQLCVNITQNYQNYTVKLVQSVSGYKSMHSEQQKHSWWIHIIHITTDKQISHFCASHICSLRWLSETQVCSGGRRRQN